MVKVGVDERKDYDEGTVELCFEHAAYALVSEETAEFVGAIGSEKVAVETGGGGFLLRCGADGVGVLEN